MATSQALAASSALPPGGPRSDKVSNKSCTAMPAVCSNKALFCTSEVTPFAAIYNSNERRQRYQRGPMHVTSPTMSKDGIACISIVRSVLNKTARYILNYSRPQLYSVFLTTTIRRIESGFNNFYYQCPPLLFTSRSRPLYIYHRASRTCDVRHSPILQSLLFSKATCILLSYRHLIDINIVTNILLTFINTSANLKHLNSNTLGQRSAYTRCVQSYNRKSLNFAGSCRVRIGRRLTSGRSTATSVSTEFSGSSVLFGLSEFSGSSVLFGSVLFGSKIPTGDSSIVC